MILRQLLFLWTLSTKPHVLQDKVVFLHTSGTKIFKTSKSKILQFDLLGNIQPSIIKKKKKLNSKLVVYTFETPVRVFHRFGRFLNFCYAFRVHFQFSFIFSLLGQLIARFFWMFLHFCLRIIYYLISCFGFSM